MSCLHGNHEDDCDICAEVAAAWNSGYASGVKTEREGCAQVCEAERERLFWGHNVQAISADKLAEAIRARGNK